MTRNKTLKDLFRIFLLFSLLGIFNHSFGQNTSNKGTDFWLGYGNHVGNQSMVIYVTSDVNTNVRVQINGIPDVIYPVTANSIQAITIPEAAYLGTDALSDKGIHVTAEKPVVVYAHIYANNVSGATLVLPTNTLGKEYYSINFTQISNQANSYSYFFVIAVEDNTEVEITPSGNTLDGMIAGNTYKKNLMKGQIYQVLGVNTGSRLFGFDAQNRRIESFYGTDLTGSKVKSVTTTAEPCKRIAVFSGSGKIGIGCEENPIGSSDNLFQQVYPTISWGKKFITVPLASRNYDVYRVLKSDPAAIIKINNVTVPQASFVSGLFYEFNSQEVNVIESDKPIQVVQYAVTQRKSINCTDYNEPVGDPEMIFLNSVEQNIEDITVFSTGQYNIITHFINIVIPTAAASSFTIDKIPQTAFFKLVPGLTGYSYAQLPVSQGVHTLSASQGFNAIAYGFGFAESYGYSAGTNVKGLNIEVQNKITKKNVSSGCVGELLRFTVKLAYQTTKIIWDLGLGSTIVSTYTKPDSIEIIDGKTYYLYALQQDVSYNVAKNYSIEIKVDRGITNDCGTTEEIPFEFTVYSPQIPNFSANTVCAGVETVFSDESLANGRPIQTWLWDFGDGKTSSEQNPKHSYAQGGAYKVKLTITNDAACGSQVIEQTVNVIKRPIPSFISSGICEKNVITFTDQSVSLSNPIIKWHWDFGDGTKVDLTTSLPVTHTYDISGAYTVKLMVETTGGCLSDTLSRSVIIHPLPKPDFSLPEVCLADAFAEFTNQSFISDNSETQFTYLWNFGDPNSVPALNVSTAKNPRHKYTAIGDYVVTLTVTSKDGCTVTTSKTLKVNGSIPKAEFLVANSSSLCSSEPVLFTNLSSVDFGNITRIEWHFDFLNDPLTKVTDESPVPGKVYTFKYPEFHDPSVIRKHTIKLIAYSGITCLSEKTIEITLKPVPDAEFNVPNSVCRNSGNLLLSAKVLSSFSGSGRFIGTGVSANNTFDPAIAGIGTHTIQYIFSPTNSCPDTVSRDITVIPVPDVDAGNDKVLLSGGQLQLSVKTTGNNLSYSWSPATGLDKTNVANPVTTTESNIIYTVTVSNEFGCVVSDQVKVSVLDLPKVPNTFTPNNDGINDVWNIRHLETYPECIVEIYTRNGKRVYFSIGYETPWDGKYQGVDVPVGTYYYLIKPKNGRKDLSGNLTILR